MMLLMVIFAAVKHRNVLKGDEIKALNDACRPWREQIVWPLRSLRLRLRAGPSPAPSAQTEQFRGKVKAAELAAERLQNQLLAEKLPLGPPTTKAPTSEQLRALLIEVVALFAGTRGEKLNGRLASSIDAIVGTTIPDAS